MQQSIVSFMEQGYLPDFLIRMGIRRLLKKRLKWGQSLTLEEWSDYEQKWVQELKSSPIAICTHDANEQHYEVPAEFFHLMLGEHLKYSSCYWPEGVESLDDAEASMLALSCQRANLQNGQHILELGCGWGSLSLWMAQHYPDSQITAVSNSNSQREWILSQAEHRGLNNLTVITSDINEFSTEETYDRVVSVEMFEHCRNYERLLQRIHSWLKTDGKLFVHLFCHQNLSYPYEEKGASANDWMTRYFFRGGQMPSDKLLYHFPSDMNVSQQWRVSGVHYAKTLRAWLNRLDANRNRIEKLFADCYGSDQTTLWWNRWRVFVMACEELFAMHQGKEWYVSHYLLEPHSSKPPRDELEEHDSIHQQVSLTV